MRIAIVNDMRLAIEALRRVVTSVPDAEIAWIAEDGQQALEKCRADRPDVVLMDLIMPVMDGVESTRRIMAECPCPIVVVTATVDGNASKVYDALGHGALDAVNTPTLGPKGDVAGGEALVRKIEMVRRMSRSSSAAREPSRPSVPLTTPCDASRGAARLVAIGASTGGPQALATVLSALPRDFSLPVVVVQHVDAEFVPGLVRWLADQVERPVRLAEPGPLVAGEIVIAGHNRHLVLDAGGRLAYRDDPTDLPHRPSVDVLFRSLAELRGVGGIAALLTGMGRDGAEGLLALRRAGWCTIAQDRGSSVVWGMPGAAVQLGAACDVLPITEIAARIARESNATSPASGRSGAIR
jgi:two-component system response regulator WspF